MSLINISGLTFAYEGSYDNIFENVSFQIDTDWKLGFTGRNGRGKTTFLNLLRGKYEYRGRITASVEFEYFPYEVPGPSQNTLEVARAVTPGCPAWALERELHLLGVPEEALGRPFETLSNGERTRVLIAALFAKENRFLLIDEPTNHLDAAGRELLGRYLGTKTGFILVSHDRAFLDGCVDHILSINKTNIEVEKGNFSSWWENKRRRDDFELAENEKLQKDIRRLQEAAKRTSDWAERSERAKIGFNPSAPDSSSAGMRPYIGGKTKKMMKRSRDIQNRRERAVEEKSQLLKNIEHAGELKMQPLVCRAATLLTMRDIAVRYGGRTAVDGVTFSIEQGDRIALLGGNGSGKSSLMKLICGEMPDYTGALYRVGGLTVSHVPQDTAFLRGDLSDYAEDCGIDESLFKTILRKLDFSRAQFDRDMADFSEGQKKKVLIARSLCEQAHLYVWDEPLNFIDVFSRMQIEEVLPRCRPTIVFAEHDRMFTQRVATKVVDL